MKKKVLTFMLAAFALIFASSARAQQADVVITLNEQFFDAVLDSIFKNTNGLELGISANTARESKSDAPKLYAEAGFGVSDSFVEARTIKTENRTPTVCNEVIRLLRERDGVRTAVRFREGRIQAPIAFTGNYNPPLIGCVEFAGVAETEIGLEFDRQRQALVGRAKVLNVNLSGTGGIGSSVLGRFVQSSIDKKINPIEILPLEKVSFAVPIQQAGTLRMRAVNVKHEIINGALNVRVTYEFLKAN